MSQSQLARGDAAADIPLVADEAPTLRGLVSDISAEWVRVNEAAILDEAQKKFEVALSEVLADKVGYFSTSIETALQGLEYHRQQGQGMFMLYAAVVGDIERAAKERQLAVSISPGLDISVQVALGATALAPCVAGSDFALSRVASSTTTELGAPPRVVAQHGTAEVIGVDNKSGIIQFKTPDGLWYGPYESDGHYNSPNWARYFGIDPKADRHEMIIVGYPRLEVIIHFNPGFKRGAGLLEGAMQVITRGKFEKSDEPVYCIHTLPGTHFLLHGDVPITSGDAEAVTGLVNALRAFPINTPIEPED